MVSTRTLCFLGFCWIASFVCIWNIICWLSSVNRHSKFKRSNVLGGDENIEASSDSDFGITEFRNFSDFLEESAIRNSRNGSKLLKPGRKVQEPKNVDVKKELRKMMLEQRCQPVENVMFLKTHKTGSSTITNILNRYADLRELLVALPAMNDFRFAWPRKFHWTYVDMLRLDQEPANVLSNHARYNREQMDLVMKSNSKYITILRDPVTQFESSFYYFEYDKILQLRNKSNPMEEFLKDPDRHLYNATLKLGDLPEQMNLIQSGMIYDLGYDFLDFEEQADIERAVSRLGREFDLVLIMEYFDESLVLMKREFCWDFDDILYIKMNQRKYKRPVLTEKIKDSIKRWNVADVYLYNYFNRTFWQNIRRHGKEFWKDVTEFRRRNKEMTRTCSPKEVVTKGFRIDVDVRSLVMNPKANRYHRYLCQKMLMNEIEYMKYFRVKLGLNYGYQKILIEEGIKRAKTHELKKRLMKQGRGARFFVKR